MTDVPVEPCGVCAACVNGVPSECKAGPFREHIAELVERESDVLESLAEDD